MREVPQENDTNASRKHVWLNAPTSPPTRSDHYFVGTTAATSQLQNVMWIPGLCCVTVNALNRFVDIQSVGRDRVNIYVAPRKCYSESRTVCDT